jgi:hypothetical protein
MIFQDDMLRFTLTIFFKSLCFFFSILVSMKHYARSDVLLRIIKLQEKIDVEIKIYEAAEKIYLMYEPRRMLEDKRTKMKAKESLTESMDKIALLKSALSKYQSIDRVQWKKEIVSEIWIQRQRSLTKMAVTGKLKGMIGDVLLELKGTNMKRMELYMAI